MTTVNAMDEQLNDASPIPGSDVMDEQPRTDFTSVFFASPHERIDAIKQGAPAAHVRNLAERMSIPKALLIDTLRLSGATVNRKARTGVRPTALLNKRIG